MSAKDERIIKGTPGVLKMVDELIDVTNQISNDRRRQRLLIRKLLTSGLTTRFVGRLSDMSHQTVARIRDEA